MAEGGNAASDASHVLPAKKAKTVPNKAPETKTRCVRESGGLYLHARSGARAMQELHRKQSFLVVFCEPFLFDDAEIVSAPES